MNKMSSYGSDSVFQFGLLDLDTLLPFKKLINSF